MKCPYCGSINTHVLDSRQTEDQSAIRRRRQCEDCEKRFTTYEKVENVPLMVIKRDHSRQMFDRGKLIERIMRACHKRPISTAAIEQLADEIENTVRSSHDMEITSQEIGEIVLKALKDLDQVAYVRFASVYRDFTDVDSFMLELQKLKDSKTGE